MYDKLLVGYRETDCMKFWYVLDRPTHCTSLWLDAAAAAGSRQENSESRTKYMIGGKIPLHCVACNNSDLIIYYT